MPILIRTLALSDVPSAMELSTGAGWNQTAEDWRRIIQLSANGCRCVEDAGKIVATITLLRYGTDLAWIGMVLTRPEYRRQGLAKQLVEDAIAGAERDGIRTLKLDATDEGRPLYEGLGFAVEEAIERWGRKGRAIGAKGISLAPKLEIRSGSLVGPMPDGLVALDTRAFGVPRKQLLEKLCASGRWDFTGNGYVLSRAGRTARCLGPCVASSEEGARQLIATHLGGFNCEGVEPEGPSSLNWYWDLLPKNSEAVSCAEDCGFTRRRILWRMRRGETITNNDAMIYANAGFELG